MGWREERPELAQQVDHFEVALKKVSDDLASAKGQFERGRFDLPSIVFCDEYLARLDRHRKGIAQALDSEAGVS